MAETVHESVEAAAEPAGSLDWSDVVGGSPAESPGKLAEAPESSAPAGSGGMFEARRPVAG